MRGDEFRRRHFGEWGLEVDEGGVFLVAPTFPFTPTNLTIRRHNSSQPFRGSLLIRSSRGCTYVGHPDHLKVFATQDAAG